jgi:hypothetical protein
MWRKIRIGLIDMAPKDKKKTEKGTQPPSQSSSPPDRNAPISIVGPEQTAIPSPPECKPDCSQMPGLFVKIASLLKTKCEQNSKLEDTCLKLEEIKKLQVIGGACTISGNPVDPLMLLLYAHYALSRYWLIDGIKDIGELAIIQKHLDDKVKDLSDPWCHKEGDSPLECGKKDLGRCIPVKDENEISEKIGNTEKFEIKWVRENDTSIECSSQEWIDKFDIDQSKTTLSGLIFKKQNGGDVEKSRFTEAEIKSLNDMMMKASKHPISS